MPRSKSPHRQTDFVRSVSPGRSNFDLPVLAEHATFDLGEPKGDAFTRGVTPTPSQSPSVGRMEMETDNTNQMFLREMHTFMREMQHMTPTQRFEITQKALLDMQEMVNVHKAMREKSERNAAEHKKNCLDAEAECSRLRIDNAALEKSCNLREENLLKERQKGKQLSADLKKKTEEAFENAQKAHALERNLKYAQEDCDKKAQEIQKLQSKNEQLTDELAKSEAHVERLEKQIDASRLQGVETEKKLRHTERELMATKAVEQAAWQATQKSRNSIIEGIDEALLMNPNHFHEVDMLMHNDRGVTVAGNRGVF